MDSDDLTQFTSATTSSLSNTISSNLNTSTASTTAPIGSTSNTYWNNLTWTSPYNATTSIYSATTDTEGEGLGKVLIKCLTEKELENLLDTIKSKAPEEMFKDAIYSIIMGRHCTEEFILKYLNFENIDPSTLKNLLFVKHDTDILSGNYAQIALYLSLS